jgi:phosphatidylinositol-3-phosphatase
MRVLAMSAMVMACLTFPGCSSDASPGRPLSLPRVPARSTRSRFVLVVLENRELGEVVGTGGTPYLASLVSRGTLATDYHAIAHPSLPNYISLLAGGPLGIESDCTECEAHGTTLVDQLERARISWGAYMQDMPQPCYQGASAGGYAKKHDPFMYFRQVAGNRTRCGKVVPLEQLAGVLGRGRLPSFVWITPNLCDDGHDCSLATVDRFLASLLPSLIRGLGSQGVLALVWDEGTSNSACCNLASAGRTPLILVGPKVRAGYRLQGPADHYSLLRLVEDSFGLPRLRGAGCRCTPSLNMAFTNGWQPHLRSG